MNANTLTVIDKLIPLSTYTYTHMQTLSLTLVSMKKRCDSKEDDKEARKTQVMADLKRNLPIEMSVNDVYGLSHSVANVNLRGEDEGFGLRGGRSQISVYEDVN